MSILAKDVNVKSVLAIFDTGVNIDQKLPKWVNASKALAEKKENGEAKQQNSSSVRIEMRQTYYDAGTGTQTTNMNTPFTVYSTPEPYEIKTDKVSFDEVAAANLKELTMLIKSGELNNVLSGYGGMHNEAWNLVTNGNTYTMGSTGEKKSASKFSKFIKKLFKKMEAKPEISVIDFFTKVKLESKEGAEIYVDRVSKYLQAIHNAYTVGQTALVEKLLSEMVANKYEALLASRGAYYAISEQRVVDFVNKTERGVELTYLKNFTRPIPQEAIDKVIKANEYEVFDNYVVMHYDPKGEHRAETKKEEAKRKDPIIFGVIAGSRKLYYITDWIDEFCNLTLDKFVDTLGTTKDEFQEGVEKKKEEVKESPVKEEKPKKKSTRKKKEEPKEEE
jgi:hypothetical protein